MKNRQDATHRPEPTHSLHIMLVYSKVRSSWPVCCKLPKPRKSYGDQVLLDNAEATITDNVKVGFIGRNGAGKCTLLQCILGEEELDSGEVIRHPSLRARLPPPARSVPARRDRPSTS